MTRNDVRAFSALPISLLGILLVLIPATVRAENTVDSIRSVALNDSLLAVKYKFTTNLNKSLADSLHLAADSLFISWCNHSATMLNGNMILKEVRVSQRMAGTIDWEITC